MSTRLQRAEREAEAKRLHPTKHREIVITERNREIVALQKRLKVAVELLKMCRQCDLWYDMHSNIGYGIGQKIAGVEITEWTAVADVVDAFLASKRTFAAGGGSS